MIEFRLPSLGADMDEGKLLEWMVKPGDAVKRGQIVALVDTSKAAIEVESWHEGTVFELVAQPGETLPVGTLIATLLAPGENGEGARGDARPAVQAAPGPATGAPPAGAPPSTAPVIAPAPAPAPAPATAARRPVSPAARKHARELGVDVESLPGSGPHGAVTVDDVERAARRGDRGRAAARGDARRDAPPAAAPPDRSAGMRKAIAAAMTRSKREIPHYYVAETVPLLRATQWLAQANLERPVSERLLMGALQLKAVALALRKFPELNGFWRDDAFQPAAGIHPGVAISIRQGGLIAPALHDAGELPLAELMRALQDLVRRARAGSLRSSEMSDSTVTVTNLGDQGVESVFGVIHPPQVALVGFGRVAERPWAENGALRAAPLVNVSLAADHRVSDGHRGARFLAALRELLQHPEAL